MRLPVFRRPEPQVETSLVCADGVIELCHSPGVTDDAVRLVMSMISVADEYARVRAGVCELALLIDATLDQTDDALSRAVAAGFVFEVAPAYWQISGRIAAPSRVGTV